MHNRTVNNALQSIKMFNRIGNVEEDAEKFASSINSYLGLMKQHDSYAIRRELISNIDDRWWKVLYIGPHFNKVVVKKRYRKREQTKENIKQNCLINKRKSNGKFTGTNKQEASGHTIS